MPTLASFNYWNNFIPQCPSIFNSYNLYRCTCAYGTTPAQLKKAIESNEGIKGVRVTLVPDPKITGRKKIKWDGISSLSNFEITSTGVRSFKAYGIGAGHFQSWTSFQGMGLIGWQMKTIFLFFR